MPPKQQHTPKSGVRLQSGGGEGGSRGAGGHASGRATTPSTWTRHGDTGRSGRHRRPHCRRPPRCSGATGTARGRRHACSRTERRCPHANPPMAARRHCAATIRRLSAGCGSRTLDHVGDANLLRRGVRGEGRLTAVAGWPGRAG